MAYIPELESDAVEELLEELVEETDDVEDADVVVDAARYKIWLTTANNRAVSYYVVLSAGSGSLHRVNRI